MQIKKCQWINKPENSKIFSSKALSFQSTATHALFHTFEEEGRLTLSWENDETVKIYSVFLNTDIEHVAFSFSNGKVEKYLQLQDIKTKDVFYIENNKSIEIEKRGKSLTFYSNGEVLSTLERDNIKASVSLGLVAVGEGKVIFNFVFSPF